MIHGTAHLLALFLGTATIPGAISMDPSATKLAVAGCCMHRDSGGQWRIAHRDFQRCRREKEEGRNVMERSGSVWWNSAC